MVDCVEGAGAIFVGVLPAVTGDETVDDEAITAAVALLTSVTLPPANLAPPALLASKVFAIEEVRDEEEVEEAEEEEAEEVAANLLTDTSDCGSWRKSFIKSNHLNVCTI